MYRCQGGVGGSRRTVGTDAVYDESSTAVLKRSCTEMDSTVDILGKLMVVLDAGHQRVVANCLLSLTPEELKACRLVCRTWNVFIRDEIWKSSWGRSRLTEKLVDRWMTVDAVAVELTSYRFMTQGRKRATSIFCDDVHVFCGFVDHEKVEVFNISSGLLVKELTPALTLPWPNHPDPVLRGADGILSCGPML